jgi:hypothetical protein
MRELLLHGGGEKMFHFCCTEGREFKASLLVGDRFGERFGERTQIKISLAMARLERCTVGATRCTNEQLEYTQSARVAL